MQAPYFVNEDSARGTGQIPDKEDMMYTVPRDGFYAIPTAEVPVTNFHRDEIIELNQLPLKYCGYTPCWRRARAVLRRVRVSLTRFGSNAQSRLLGIEQRLSNSSSDRFVLSTSFLVAEGLCRRTVQ